MTFLVILMDKKMGEHNLGNVRGSNGLSTSLYPVLIIVDDFITNINNVLQIH